MYQTKHIKALIDKANNEAEKAAQVIFDKYNDKLISLIKNQLHPKDKLITGMGTCLLQRNGKTIEHNDFTEIIVELQYNPGLEASFNVSDDYTKY